MRGRDTGGAGWPPMKITIAEIPVEGLRLTERLDPAALALNTPETTFTEPVRVSAFVRRHEEDLLVEVTADSRLTRACGRCLAPCPQPYHGAFHLELEIPPRQLSMDLTDEVRQEILLSEPMTFLCRQECQGLCPTCGQNLNEHPCAHHGDSP